MNGIDSPHLAALRRCGYRAKHRYIVFRCCRKRSALAPEVWRVLDKCHDIRNVAEYEGTLDIGERIVTDLVAACGAVVRAMDLLE
jgi:hypothetical protein